MAISMELLQHLGLYSRDADRLTFYQQLRGFAILTTLFVYLLFYHGLSIALSMWKNSIPSVCEQVKREAASKFWRLSLYYLDLNGVEIQIVGDDLESDSALIISNHRSIADHFVIQYLARLSLSRDYQIQKESEMKGMILPRVNFFTWFSIWSIPTIRVLFNMAGCDENWELDESLNLYTFKKVVTSKVLEWIVLFPEVNIFTPESSSIQGEMSAKYYLPKLNHLLYPRFSSFFNSAQLLTNTSFSRLYDITIVYYRSPVERKSNIASSVNTSRITNDDLSSSPLRKLHRRERRELVKLGDIKEPIDVPLLSESSTLKRDPGSISMKPGGEFKAPTLLEILSILPSNYVIRVHVKSKLLARVPVKRRKLEKWLESQWCEKDKLIEMMEREILAEISDSSN